MPTMTAVKRKSAPSEDGERPKKSKTESREEQRNVRKERKSHDRTFDMITEAKKLWEQLRRGDTKREEQKKLMEQIMNVITGRVQDVIFKHDASRIIQTCLKKGNAEQRGQIVDELQGKFAELTKSMYGKFIVLKALEHCHWKRDSILNEFRTHIRKLIRHKEASTVIEAFYSQFSNSAQRQELLAEFYGPEVTLFSSGGGAKTLDSLLASLPEKKDSILKYMGDVLVGCTDKGTIVHSIVHKVLLQYLELADEKGREKIMSLLFDNLPEMIHTRDGAHVAMLCLSYASPKDRKAIIKAFKPFLEKIAKDEHGYLVLLRLLDVTDDTVLVTKAVVNELCKHAKDLFAEKFGRRFFLYILIGRNTKFLSADTIKLLQAGDAIRTSKKDPELRSKELLNAASPELIKVVATHASVLLREALSIQVVQEIMLHAEGDKTAAVDAILAVINQDVQQEDHVFNNVTFNRAMRKLVKADSEEADKNAATSLDLAPKLLDCLRPNMGYIATHAGSFVVVALAEEPSTAKETLKELKSFKKNIAQAAKDGNKGAVILTELLSKK